MRKPYIVNLLPAYMEPARGKRGGSEGVGALLWLEFLKDQGFNQDLIMDAYFGSVGAARTVDWQKANNLKPTGGFGPEDRVKALEQGFDFLSRLNWEGGPTIFVQPQTGKRLAWRPIACTKPEICGADYTPRWEQLLSKSIKKIRWPGWG